MPEHAPRYQQHHLVKQIQGFCTSNTEHLSLAMLSCTRLSCWKGTQSCGRVEEPYMG
jgi:hypothetical protein